MVAKEIKVLIVRFEKTGRRRNKERVGAHIYLDPIRNEIIIRIADNDLRQKILAKIATLKAAKKDSKAKGNSERIPSLSKIKTLLLNRRRKGIVPKEAEYFTFHFITSA